MSTQRADSDGDAEPVDCRRRDRYVLGETGSAAGRQSERRRQSTPTASSGSAASSARYGRSTLSVSGLALLTVTKLSDALTTGIGLVHLPGVYEANPVVASLFREVGVVIGLAVVSAAIIAGVTLVVEISSVLVSVRRRDGHLAPVVRLVGYGVPSVCFAIVSIHNAGVLVSGLQMGAAVPW
jgi:hypothetical protein